MKNILSLIGALVVLIGTIFSVYFYFEHRYALAEELQKTQQRLEYKILADQLNSIQERLWKIQDRCGSKQPDQTTKEEIRQLEKSKIEVSDKLKAMEKK